MCDVMVEVTAADVLTMGWVASTDDSGGAGRTSLILRATAKKKWVFGVTYIEKQL